MTIHPIRRSGEPDHVATRAAAENAGRALVQGLIAQAADLSAALAASQGALGVPVGVANELVSLQRDMNRRLQTIEDIRRRVGF